MQNEFGDVRGRVGWTYSLLKNEQCGETTVGFVERLRLGADASTESAGVSRALYVDRVLYWTHCKRTGNREEICSPLPLASRF